jgi:hypothetical protein
MSAFVLRLVPRLTDILAQGRGIPLSLCLPKIYPGGIYDVIRTELA